MTTHARALALAGSLLLLVGNAMADATVTFSHPENFRDMPFGSTDRARVLNDLGEHVAQLGKTLPAGQRLRVEVLDLDMAGRIEPEFRGRQEIRVLRGGADWPHMTLRYRLEANGQVIASGQDDLRDMDYLRRLNRYAEGDTLRYEKRMIDDWFKQTILARKAG